MYSSSQTPGRSWDEMSFWDQEKQNDKRDWAIKGFESLDHNCTFIEQKSTELKTSPEGPCIEKTTYLTSYNWSRSICAKTFFNPIKVIKCILHRFLSKICLCILLCFLLFHLNLTQLIKGKGIWCHGKNWEGDGLWDVFFYDQRMFPLSFI